MSTIFKSNIKWFSLPFLSATLVPPLLFSAIHNESSLNCFLLSFLLLNSISTALCIHFHDLPITDILLLFDIPKYYFIYLFYSLLFVLISYAVSITHLRFKCSTFELSKQFNILLFLFISSLSFTSSAFYYAKLRNLELEQIIYHLKTEISEDAADSMMNDFYKSSVKPAIFSTIIMFVIVNKVFPLSFKAFNRQHTSNGLIAPVIILLCSLTVFFDIVKPQEFIKIADSPFIKDNYVSPKKMDFRFPQKKRNFIFIILESMETTFASKDIGGCFNKSAIPELTNLSYEDDSIFFSDTDNFGGGRYSHLAHWSVSGRLAMEGGIPFKFLDSKNSDTIPGLYTIFDLLKENGYDQHLVFGHSNKTWGIVPIYKTHGDFTFWDSTRILASNPKRYSKFKSSWGLNDIAIIDFATKLLSGLVKRKNPFTLLLHTVDTHFPYGVKCPMCANDFNNTLFDSYVCSSKVIYKFVKNIQKTSWYKDTTIALIGDHHSMAEWFDTKYYGNDCNRRIYNTIINSAVKSNHTKNREFMHYDWFPTLVRSLGIDFDGNKLGMGVDLFSGEKTLAEKTNNWDVNEKVKPYSQFAMEEFLYQSENPVIIFTADPVKQ